MKYTRVSFLLILMLFLNLSMISAQSSEDIDTGINGTFYQYEQGSNRLEYTMSASRNVMYYLYDNNGNLTKKISSTNFPLFVSSKLSGWEAYKLGDSNPGTIWSSKANGNGNAVEWVAADLGRVSIVNQISLTPRAAMAFPKDFKIQSSYDAVTWTDIPGQQYSNYINNGSVQTFQFGSGVAAKYIRVYATKLTTDDRGSYYFQLADFKINQSNVSTSSNLDGWEATKLTDNNASTNWSSVAHGNESETEWIVLGMGDEKSITGISLTPRAKLSFPRDFKLQTSNDALHWIDIPNQTYSNYNNNGLVQIFNFGSTVKARYIRVYATKLGKDDMGNYYFQLGEIKANLAAAAAS
ncbi:discoidin domain-containing protein [Paenibacillus sp. S150]|uniref:discoidin domain-containing protein n=1 Tax=Paenibacillus sp. S150 TaxID=2749826 RepID=UPI001C563C19|nr:discoidin domain-containing protein [Paenibacillus sp. S150]MBW4085760.1 discoidin domain-containing protein [Paenibacillus sp. S150]